MRISFCILLLVLTVSYQAMPCGKILTKVSSELKKIMETAKPVRLKKGGIVTYSHDTELGARDWINYIFEDPKATAELDKLAGSFTLADISNGLGMSSEQLRRTALRPGKTLSPESNLLSFLKPEYAADYLGIIVTNNASLSPTLISAVDIVERTAKKRKDPVTVTNDSNAIEIAHKSYDDTPAKAKKTYDWLFSQFKEPSSHLHMGLPFSDISYDQAMTIGKTLEAIILLQRAAYRYDNLGDLNQNGGSTLANSPWKGVLVVYGPKTVKVFHNAHNLEIRQYGSKMAGLYLMGLATVLAKNAGKIDSTSEKQYGRHASESGLYNDRLGNIVGALHYASDIFERQEDPKAQKIAKRLMEFKEIFANDNYPDAPVHKSLQKFLIENNIVGRLFDPAMYLNR